MSVGDARVRKSQEPEKEPEPPPKVKTPCEHALDFIQSLAKSGARRVGIVGSREFSDMQAVIDFVNKLPAGSTVVSGRGRGVDKVAEDIAKARGLKTDIYPADWNKYGRSAGLRRNPSSLAILMSLLRFTMFIVLEVVLGPRILCLLRVIRGSRCTLFHRALAVIDLY